MSSIRDKFWIWGQDSGAHNGRYNLPRPSRITPVEAAYYMGIPNVIVVGYYGLPKPPYDQYAIPLRSLREVVWSVVGAGGETQEAERAHVLGLTKTLPNMSGVMMDDFFRSSAEVAGALSFAELDALQERLNLPEGKKLDLWVVLYDHQLHLPVQEHLRRCDVVSFWTWEARHLADLEANFARAEALAPGKRMVLGCYMWDYGAKQPMPLELMQKQCEIGLRWLREGRIEGMIFLASCICDIELETVEWTRRWIAEVA
jgi:hypothetical protein